MISVSRATVSKVLHCIFVDVFAILGSFSAFVYFARNIFHPYLLIFASTYNLWNKKDGISYLNMKWNKFVHSHNKNRSKCYKIHLINSSMNMAVDVIIIHITLIYNDIFICIYMYWRHGFWIWMKILLKIWIYPSLKII